MSKGLYVGDANKAKKIKSLFIGGDGKAHKIKKAYIGDENNKARLIYMNGYEYDYDMYVWNKYNLNSTITEGSSYAIDNIDDLGYIYKDITIISGSIYGQDSYQDVKTGRYEYVNGLWREYPYFDGNPSYYGSAPDGWYKATSSTSANIITLSQSKGSYIGEVTATSRSEYPDNGASGNYWYVYDRFYTQKIISEYKVVKTTSTTKIMSQVGASAEARCYSTLGVLEDGTIFGNESQSAVLRVGDLPSSDYPYTGAGKHWYKITSKSGRMLYTVYGTLLSTSKE